MYMSRHHKEAVKMFNLNEKNHLYFSINKKIKQRKNIKNSKLLYDVFLGLSIKNICKNLYTYEKINVTNSKNSLYNDIMGVKKIICISLYVHGMTFQKPVNRMCNIMINKINKTKFFKNG